MLACFGVADQPKSLYLQGLLEDKVCLRELHEWYYYRPKKGQEKREAKVLLRPIDSTGNNYIEVIFQQSNFCYSISSKVSKL
jgi:hypothetical protein